MQWIYLNPSGRCPAPSFYAAPFCDLLRTPSEFFKFSFHRVAGISWPWERERGVMTGEVIPSSLLPYPLLRQARWSPFCCCLRAWFSSWRTASAAIPAVPRRSLVTPSLSGTRTLASQCQDWRAARPVSLASCVWLAAVPTVSPTTAMRRTSVSWHTSVCECKWSDDGEYT